MFGHGFDSRHLHTGPFWSKRLAHEIPHTGFLGRSCFRPQPHIFKALYNNATEVKWILAFGTCTTDKNFQPVKKVEKSATWYYSAHLGSSFCNSFPSNTVQAIVSAISFFQLFSWIGFSINHRQKQLLWSLNWKITFSWSTLNAPKPARHPSTFGCGITTTMWPLPLVSSSRPPAGPRKQSG